MTTIDEALSDRLLLGAALDRDLSSWATWRVVLRAAFGLPLHTDEEFDTLEALAGPRRSPPTARVSELWAIAGRRSGKSRVAALIASYIAAFEDHSGKLAPGEVGYVLILSPTRDQSKVIASYVQAFFASSPVLRQLVMEANSEEIRLQGNIVIAIHPNSFRTVRGRTLIACIFDESAFWRDESSALPDLETYRAVTPALATTGGLLVGISSPYRKVGLLHARHRDFYNTDAPDVLVIQGATATLNPLIDRRIIDRAKKDDAEAASAEWDGNFRTDISALLDDYMIDDAIDLVRPVDLPRSRHHRYFAFTDASAGKHDSFTLAIGHLENEYEENEHFVLDVLRATRPPFDPAIVAGEYAALARFYGVSHLTGDAYAGNWVSEAFNKAGVRYHTSRLNKSQLYLEAVQHFARRAITIPNYAPLIRELRLLERRVSRSGRDSVDHPQNGSDDMANALVGCLYQSTLNRPVPARMLYGR
ncbi:terminase [Aquibium sp. LZ166]|uniref:Terminase n=1 Tax=Aquibium pacificus TaxID=3153579 RepID=A0ABV3SGV1_9HYPH